MKYKFLIIFFSFIYNISNAQVSDFDKSIIALKPKSINELALSINRLADTEYLKARAIYTWVAYNINYDLVAFMKGMITDQSPEFVFKNRIAVCQGYSDLYYLLARKLGLKAEVITGFSKGFNYEQRLSFKQTDHAWNAVKIDGKWQLLDVTWGGGYVDGNGKYIHELSYDMFLCKPEKFIFKHLPADPVWQLNEVNLPLTYFKKDSVEIKKFISDNKNKSVLFADTLINIEKLDSISKALNSYHRIAKYNTQSAEGYYKLSWYYFQKSWSQMNQLNDSSIQRDKSKAIPMAKESLILLKQAENYLLKVKSIDSDYDDEVNQKLKIIKQNVYNLEQIIKS